MNHYAVHYTYVDDADLIARHRPDHRRFLSSLVGKGVVVAGACPGTTPPSALLIVQADSPEAVDDLLADDPFRHHGVLADHRVVAWTPVIGSLGS
ncbi:MAG: YciI family protein [Arachnia propionica]|uniref:YciI family protein n=1 Tax=Arachnia propionica TaxID=1750 RepID=UPI00270832D5|nr:YciI family protein [Arachnia propionica]